MTLRKDLATPVVPGKLLSIMAAGRPVITSLPLSGDAPRIIERYDCGLCVEPDEPDNLVKAVLKLYNDALLREKMGANGRKAAETAFSRDVCVAEYEKLLNECKNKGKDKHGS